MSKEVILMFRRVIEVILEEKSRGEERERERERGGERERRRKKKEEKKKKKRRRKAGRESVEEGERDECVMSSLPTFFNQKNDIKSRGNNGMA